MGKRVYNHLSFLSVRLRGHITYANRLFINPPLLPLFSTLKGSLNYSYLPPGVELEGKGEKRVLHWKKNLVRASLLFFFLPLSHHEENFFFWGGGWAKRGGKVRWAFSPLSVPWLAACAKGVFSPSLTSNLPSSSSSSSLSSPLWRRFHPPVQPCCPPLLPLQNRLQGFAAGGC